MNVDAIITQHFTLSELTRSNTADIMGLNNHPCYDYVQNLHALCEHVLEPLRNQLNRRVIITSAFRNHDVNYYVGGSHCSQHLEGKAADLYINKETKDKMWEILKTLDFDQLILERNKNRIEWIHVSYNGSKNRHQIIPLLTKSS